VRLARAGCGGVDYWMGLPIIDVFYYMLELAEQIEEENKAMEEAARRR
jgi:hypothetical protein